MARQAHYNAADHIAADTTVDPYNRPSFSTTNKLMRLVWSMVHATVYKLSPRPAFAWRTAILRLFGAKLGPHCRFYPHSVIWAPWNLICEDTVVVADGAEIYNPAPIHLGSHFTLSQTAFICGATHDYDDPGFPLIAYAMHFGAYAWVCARASVAPGVAMGEGAVLGLASVATRDMEPWSVYAGAPAVRIKDRKKHSV